MYMNKKEDKEFSDEMDRWIKEETIDLNKYCNDKELEILRKFGYEKNLYSEFHFGNLLCRIRDYYNYEELKNKKELNCYEKKLLEEFIFDQLLTKKCVKKRYVKDIKEEKKLEDVGVSEKEYKMLLAKLEIINCEIIRQKQIRRAKKAN